VASESDPFQPPAPVIRIFPSFTLLFLNSPFWDYSGEPPSSRPRSGRIDGPGGRTLDGDGGHRETFGIQLLVTINPEQSRRFAHSLLSLHLFVRDGSEYWVETCLRSNRIDDQAETSGAHETFGLMHDRVPNMLRECLSTHSDNDDAQPEQGTTCIIAGGNITQN
jgi:hypothetical protein